MGGLWECFNHITFIFVRWFKASPRVHVSFVAFLKGWINNSMYSDLLEFEIFEVKIKKREKLWKQMREGKEPTYTQKRLAHFIVAGGHYYSVLGFGEHDCDEDCCPDVNISTSSNTYKSVIVFVIVMIHLINIIYTITIQYMIFIKYIMYIIYF